MPGELNETERREIPLVWGIFVFSLLVSLLAFWVKPDRERFGIVALSAVLAFGFGYVLIRHRRQRRKRLEEEFQRDWGTMSDPGPTKRVRAGLVAGLHWARCDTG